VRFLELNGFEVDVKKHTKIIGLPEDFSDFVNSQSCDISSTVARQLSEGNYSFV